jgi:hypothetical protein
MTSPSAKKPLASEAYYTIMMHLALRARSRVDENKKNERKVFENSQKVKSTGVLLQLTKTFLS